MQDKLDQIKKGQHTIYHKPCIFKMESGQTWPRRTYMRYGHGHRGMDLWPDHEWELKTWAMSIHAIRPLCQICIPMMTMKSLPKATTRRNPKEG